MEKLENHYVGRFVFGMKRHVGRLVLSGPETLLQVESSTPIAFPSFDRVPMLRGTTQTGKKISLCVVDGHKVGSGPSSRRKRYYTADFFPHYVALGPRYVDPGREVISAISFTTDGAKHIFADHESFGIGQVDDISNVLPARAKKDKRPIKHSQLFYYIARGPIVAVQTKQIKFQAYNDVSYKFPSADGIRLDNVIRIRLQFKAPVKLQDAIEAAYDFRSFCELMTLGPQCMCDLMIEHKAAKKDETPLSLVISYADKPIAEDVSFRNTLIKAGSNPDEFQRVLSNWMTGQNERRIARLRVIQGIRDRTFTIDRLIAAANAFDLLPFDNPSLPTDVHDKINELRGAVKEALPYPLFEPVLDALGRLGGRNLRSKILARFQLLPASLQSHLPEMEKVIGHCVQARNYFVHGTRPRKLSVQVITDNQVFFTQTLEFIFVTAELSECGWDWQSWRRTGGSSPLTYYLDSYQHQLQELKKMESDGAGAPSNL